jgi:outer membrane autotransporter protein
MTKIFLPVIAIAMTTLIPFAAAREIVVLPGVVGATGELSGVDTQGPGLLTIGNQNINTSNDVGGAITSTAANTASILFTGSSVVTGRVGAVGATFLDIAAGANGNTVTFNGQVFSTTFSLSGTGTVNFNGGFVSNTGSTLDFAGDGFINVGAGQTVKAAITNSAGASTGTLTLNGNSILDGAVGAASGLKEIRVVGGNALITGQVNAASYTLGTNTLNSTGAFAIPVAGVINTTIFSPAVYGKIVPGGFATIGNALQVNVTVTGPLTVGNNFDIVDAASGTTGSTVLVSTTSNSLRYEFTALPTTNGLVRITASQVPLAVIVAPIGNPIAPGIAPVVDALPVNPITLPVLTAITVLPTADAVADALTQLNPSTTNLNAPQTGYRVGQLFQEQWSSHLGQVQADCGREGQDPDRAHPEYTSACKSDARRPHWWISGIGSWGEQSNTQGFEGYDSRIGGVMIAFETPLCFCDGLRAGFGLGYARSSLDGNTYNTESDINSYQAVAYLGYAPGPWFLNGALSYGLDDYSGSRQVAFPGFSGTSNADYNGSQFTAFATTGYHFYVGDGDTIITPLATLQFTHLRVGGYTETGNPAIDLRVNAQHYNFLQSGLGAKIARNMRLSDKLVLRPELHANWLHSFANTTMRNNAAFTAGGPAFTVSGLAPKRDTYNVGAGVTLATNGAWSVEGLYDYQWRAGRFSAHQAMLTFSMRF